MHDLLDCATFDEFSGVGLNFGTVPNWCAVGICNILPHLMASCLTGHPVPKPRIGLPFISEAMVFAFYIVADTSFAGGISSIA